MREGGHNIPNDVVIRRYWVGLRNMRLLYLPLADVAAIYDNSDERGMLIAEKPEHGPLIIHDADRWAETAGAKP